MGKHRKMFFDAVIVPALGGQSVGDAWRMACQIADEMVLEGHQRDRAGIAGQAVHHRFNQPAILAGYTLELDDKRNLTVYQIQHHGKGGDAFLSAANGQSGKLLRGLLPDMAVLPGQSVKVIVMEHDRHAISCKMNIAFDRKTMLNGCAEGCERIFPSRPVEVVQTPVSDREG